MGKYDYLNYNGVICRYERNSKNKSHNAIGEVYNQRTKKWIRSLDTVEYEMSGASVPVKGKIKF